MKNDDVAPARILDSIVHAIYENSLAYVQSWLHGCARDAVGLDQERLDEQGEPERRSHDQDEFEQGSVTTVPQPPECVEQG
jgi:hypothetical protein